MLAVGRNAVTPRQVAAAGERVVPVAFTGDAAADTDALRAAAGGPIDAALDMIGANSAAATGRVLRSLRRGGRMAMMGSCSEPLSIGYAEMLASWRLDAVIPRTYALADLSRAMDEARTMRGLEITALVNEPR